jgi:hypothetical protein
MKYRRVKWWATPLRWLLCTGVLPVRAGKWLGSLLCGDALSDPQ